MNNIDKLVEKLKFASDFEKIDVYNELYELFKAQSDYKNALDYLEKQVKLKDEVYDSSTDKKIADLHAQYKSEKNKRESELAESRAEVHRLTNVELAHANATQDKFFSIIGHDLKNPLAAVIGFSEILSDMTYEMSNEEIKSFSRKINLSGVYLLSMLNNMLAWARSQTGRMPYQPKNLTLLPAVEQIVSTFKSNASTKSIKMQIDIYPDAAIFVDRDLLRITLHNLLSNAIKFTPNKGKVVVSAILKGAMVEIAVVDSGVGISDDVISNLFRMDVHFSTAGTAKEKGTGLGLLLCKDFVEKNGGAIWLESEVDKGSAFKFTAPVARQESHNHSVSGLSQSV